jgi:hypothetical protein
MIDITTATPATLLLGLYHRDGRSALMGSLRHTDGELEEGVFAKVHAGDPYQLLADSLDEAALLKVSNLIVFTNVREMAELYTLPITIPQDGPPEKVFVLSDKVPGKTGYYAAIPTGGNPHQWRILRTIFAGYENFRFVYAEILKKAEELWKQPQ